MQNSSLDIQLALTEITGLQSDTKKLTKIVVRPNSTLQAQVLTWHPTFGEMQK